MLQFCNLVTVPTLNVYLGSEASIVFIQKSKQNKQEFKTGLFDVILDNVVAASAQLDPTLHILISTIHRQHFQLNIFLRQTKLEGYFLQLKQRI